jgi:thiosulfate reductase cytochrome b subunit
MEIRLKHLRAIRWFHWINFPLLILMTWSGLMIYWAYPVYGIGSIRFFPDWFYSALRLDQRLAAGMALHFFVMWFFVLNGIAYVAYTIFSGEWRFLARLRLFAMHGKSCCTTSTSKRTFHRRKNTTQPNRLPILRSF